MTAATIVTDEDFASEKWTDEQVEYWEAIKERVDGCACNNNDEIRASVFRREDKSVVCLFLEGKDKVSMPDGVPDKWEDAGSSFFVHKEADYLYTADMDEQIYDNLSWAEAQSLVEQFLGRYWK